MTILGFAKFVLSELTPKKSLNKHLCVEDLLSAAYVESKLHLKIFSTQELHLINQDEVQYSLNMQ